MIAIMSSVLLERLRGLATAERHLAAGTVLFRQGDPVRVLHLVVEGEACLVRHRPDGGTLVLQRARAGTLLAEASLFARHYHCDAVAVVPSSTRPIPVPAVRALLRHEPDFVEAWSSHLAREVQASRLRAEILALRTVAERLDAWLVAHDGQDAPRGAWKGVAAEIGVSPEALYRELARRRLGSAPSARDCRPA
jgi:CRP-like cAMP-binding protein